MTTRSSHSRLRLAVVGLAAVAILATGTIVIMKWSRAQPIAEAGEPVQLAETQAPVPKPVAPHPKQPPEAQAPKPAQIDRNGVVMLVRSALLALDQANKTGNYTVLRDLGSPEFRVNSAAQLGDIFAQQRRDNIDLSGVAVLEPQLTLLPQIETNGMMHMAGFFPSVPKQVNFELLYAPVDRQWRLFGISVSVGQTAPAAPPTEQDAPQARAPDSGGVPTSSGETHATPTAEEKPPGEAKQ